MATDNKKTKVSPSSVSWSDGLTPPPREKRKSLSDVEKSERLSTLERLFSDDPKSQQVPPSTKPSLDPTFSPRETILEEVYDPLRSNVDLSPPRQSQSPTPLMPLIKEAEAEDSADQVESSLMTADIGYVPHSEQSFPLPLDLDSGRSLLDKALVSSHEAQPLSGEIELKPLKPKKKQKPSIDDLELERQKSFKRLKQLSAARRSESEDELGITHEEKILNFTRSDEVKTLRQNKLEQTVEESPRIISSVFSYLGKKANAAWEGLKKYRLTNWLIAKPLWLAAMFIKWAVIKPVKLFIVKPIVATVRAVQAGWDWLSKTRIGKILTGKVFSHATVVASAAVALFGVFTPASPLIIATAAVALAAVGISVLIDTFKMRTLTGLVTEYALLLRLIGNMSKQKYMVSELDPYLANYIKSEKLTNNKALVKDRYYVNPNLTGAEAFANTVSNNLQGITNIVAAALGSAHDAAAVGRSGISALVSFYITGMGEKNYGDFKNELKRLINKACGRVGIEYKNNKALAEKVQEAENQTFVLSKLAGDPNYLQDRAIYIKELGEMKKSLKEADESIVRFLLTNSDPENGKLKEMMKVKDNLIGESYRLEEAWEEIIQKRFAAIKKGTEANKEWEKPVNDISANHSDSVLKNALEAHNPFRELPTEAEVGNLSLLTQAMDVLGKQGSQREIPPFGKGVLPSVMELRKKVVAEAIPKAVVQPHSVPWEAHPLTQNESHQDKLQIQRSNNKPQTNILVK